MNKPTAFFPTLLLSLAISLSFAGFAEAKEPSSDAKHSVSHSSKNTAKKDVAVNKSKKEKVAASKKSAKSEKVALKDAKKVKISAKNKATKSEKIAKKTSKTEKVAKKSLKTGKTVAQKYTPSTKVERDAQRKDRNREKLAKISRTGKISQAAKYAAKPVIIASTPAAVASIRNSIQQSSNTPLTLNVESRAALVMNAVTGEVLYSKNTEQALPIASITKLMTVMVVLDAAQPLDEPITSRLKVGAVLSRAELMLLALMSSENRAAHALARNYVGGTPAALAAMNRKAHAIGMSNSRFFDGTGLSSGNVATPKDLALMVKASTTYPLIRRFSTTSEHAVAINNNVQQFRNTNYLVKSPDWEIGVSKTGFINEAGKCLVMQAKIKQTPVVIVLMDSMGKYTRIGDAQRVKKWLEAVPAN